MMWGEVETVAPIKRLCPFRDLLDEITTQMNHVDMMLDDLATDYDTQMAYEGSREELLEARIYLGRLKEQVRRYSVALGEEWD